MHAGNRQIRPGSPDTAREASGPTVAASEGTADAWRYWRGVAQGRLRFQRCTACGGATHPPRVLCPNCLADALVWEDSAGHGALFSHTALPAAPGERDTVLAAVALDEGFSMITRLVSPTEGEPPAGPPGVGARVSVRYDELDGAVLPVFVLDPGQDPAR